jgi:hypothetical protein
MTEDYLGPSDPSITPRRFLEVLYPRMDGRLVILFMFHLTRTEWSELSLRLLSMSAIWETRVP